MTIREKAAVARMFEIAWAEALERHSGQKYGPHDYSFHLQMVVDRIRSVYGDDELELAAGALHDTIEAPGPLEITSRASTVLT